MDEKGRLVAGQFSCTMQLSQQRSIQITGHTYVDDKPADLNARIDLAQNALDRQFIRIDITSKRAQIDSQRQNLLNLKDVYEEKVKKSKGGPLTSAEQQVVENYGRTVDGIKNTIADLEHSIKQAEKKLAA